MNKPSPIKSVILDNRGSVRRIVDRAQELRRLEEYIKRQLPPLLEDHCHLANVRDNVLVLQADSSAWAARLRYSAPQILSNLRRLPAFASLSSVRVTVAPAETPLPDPVRPQAAALSAKNAALLRQTAESLEEASPLRIALERLASRSVS